ncbi:peptidoglycan DD-metalloendopeptidase family protein [Chryseobacterium vrystaatense]|uniref:Predicted chitinase n=1 Tax=Chryseobacterium vrystaatense TaxID=307480 RepID=A0A1M5G7P6_9FLAO|nr:peptidoglycan DD-metalloendopeptidase family protein [Chryseobacterium vrystaatense]SHF99787.1 Predicted chitinase [Chryseobacterium vrystaatense]
MGKLTIIGNDKPIIGEKEIYSVSSVNEWGNLLQPLNNPLQTPKTYWEVLVETKTGWRKGGSNKEGQTVPYTFGQKSLFHKGIKIVVQQGEDKAELRVHPQRAKESKITKVDLLDANYKPIPKGKKLSYRDTIIARAYCVEMFMMRVAFSLWEDDAQGEGHDPVINALNKINLVPVLGTVDEKGIAEAVFRLPAYTMAVQIANARIAAGDKDEGAAHEYYVTADVINRKIQQTSPNVNVSNPTYTEAPPRQRKMPAGQSLPLPKSVPVKPKPKEETAKFPQTPAAKKQGDPEGKILSAEFTDGRGRSVKNAKTGDVVSIKIISQNMKGKNVKVRIWEEDFSKWSHDLLYEKTVQLIGETSFVNYITLTKEMYSKGYSLGEKELEYFIEVEHNNTSVTSAVIPVTLDAPQTIVPKGKSVYVVGEREVEKTTDVKCPRCKREITIDLIKQVYSNCKDSKILDELAKSLNKYKNVYKLDTCARKAHFFAQSIQESGTDLVGALHGENLNYTAEQLPIHFKKFRKRDANGNAVDKYGNPTRINSETVPNNLAYKYGKSVTNGYVANQKKIAEIAYGNRLGNQSIEDTWNFRGRGLLQITGRETYYKIQQNINTFASDSGVQIAEGQDRDYTPNEAAVTGMADWYKNNMYLEANKTGILKDNEVVDRIVNIINTDTDSRSQRKDNYKKTKIIFEVDKCLKVKPQQNKVERCTDDCSQCFNYADIWENPEISLDNHGKNNNRFGFNSARGHKGIDIVSGPEYKDIHSLMCGEVTSVVDTFKTNQYKFKSLGNTLMIKSRDKEGKTVFILYCHLNKIYVKKGDKVKHGQKVAQSGSTGNASSSEFPNGLKGHGINKKYWHCHIEAATKGDGYNNFLDLGSYRIKAEDYMNTKFDKDGNSIK